MIEVTVYMGARKATDESSLIELWTKIHNNGIFWSKIPTGPERNSDLSLLDGELALIMSNSIAKVTHKYWVTLCTAAGMTVYGAVALSWCKDAELSQVWEGWETSGFPLKPLPEYERPARFINPALLPTTNSLSELVKFAENKSLPISAMIATLKEPLQIDLPDGQLRAAGPQVASFLKSRMLQKPDRTAEETSLIEVWSQTVKGTDFDIWESA